MAPGRCRPLPSALAASPPSAMKIDGSHQASSNKSVFAPRRIAVSNTSPVSPAFAIEQNTLARLDVQRCAVARNPRAENTAVLDDQVLHGRVGPDRRLATEVDQHLEHLTNERGTVGEHLTTTEPGGPGAREHPRGHGEGPWRSIEVLHSA